MIEPHVCLVFESFCPIVGGGETHGRTLVKGLTQRGIPNLVVTLRVQPDLPAKETREGNELYRVGSGRNRWRGIAPVYKQLQALRDCYDVIYVSGFRTLGIPAVLVGQRYHKLVVLESQNNGELSGAYFGPGLRSLGLSHNTRLISFANSLRKSLLRRADHFVAVSESIKREYVENGITQDKVSWIPYGVDFDRFHPASSEEKKDLRLKLGLPLSARIVCFTGRLVSWKGPLTLLNAWQRILKTQISNLDAAAESAVLVFLGAGGSDLRNCEPEARRFVAEMNVSKSVRFEGDVRNVEDYLRAADIFAFPTEGDCLPIAVLEAISCGLAVVTTQIAGLADYVRDEVNALVVAPGDVDQLEKALQRLLTDPELGVRLGVAALRTAQNYSQERAIERRLNVFRKLARDAAQFPELLLGRFGIPSHKALSFSVTGFFLNIIMEISSMFFW